MKQRFTRRWLFLGLVLVLVAAAAIPVARALAQGGTEVVCPPDCMVSFITPSMFSAWSLEAAQIEQLFTIILVIAAIVFVVVEGLLFFAVWRYRNRPPEAAVQVHGNTKLEIAWTAFPAVILAVLVGFTFRTMAAVRAVEADNVLHVTAVGHQWWWEFRYPDLGIVTANEMVVPAGTVVEVTVESVDVIHSFWAPELFGKVDAMPGYTNRVRFMPTEARSDYFGGQCAEYCGTQHAQMRFAIVVRSPEAYADWVAQMQAEPAEPAGDAAAGRDLFMQSQCIGCHTIAGTNAVGTTGPNLTHLASRGFIAGGILANTPQNLHAWIQEPQSIKPGALMPNLGLTNAQVDDLVAYLTSLE